MNIVKLFAIVVMCFMIGAALVACGAEGPQGPAGADGKSPYMGDDGKLYVWDADKNDFVGYEIKGEPGTPGTPGTPGQNLTCGEGTHKWSEEGVEVVEHGVDSEGNLLQGVTIYMCENEGCGAASAKFTGHDYEGEGAVVKTEATCLDGAYTTYTCQTDYCQHVSVVEHEDEPALDHKPAVEFDAENIDECWKASDDIAEDACACITPVHYTTKCVNGECTEIIDAWGPEGTHTWGDPQPSDNTSNIPACQWEKSWYKKCTVCADKCSDEINCGNVVEVEELKEAPAAHVWNDGEVTTPAKCGVAGVTTYTCTLCGTETKTEPITALEHDLEHTDAKAATCTEIGWDAYDTCKRDGCEYTTYNELEALDHAFTKDDGVTDIENMVVTFTCNREGCEAVAHQEPLMALTEENCGEGKFYTYSTEGTNCANLVHLYSFSIDLGEGKEAYTDTIRINNEEDHEELTDEHIVRKVETEKYIYWMYECSECDTWVIFKHESKTQVEPV